MRAYVKYESASFLSCPKDDARFDCTRVKHEPHDWNCSGVVEFTTLVIIIIIIIIVRNNYGKLHCTPLHRRVQSMRLKYYRRRGEIYVKSMTAAECPYDFSKRRDTSVNHTNVTIEKRNNIITYINLFSRAKQRDGLSRTANVKLVFFFQYRVECRTTLASSVPFHCHSRHRTDVFIFLFLIKMFIH